MNNRKGTLAVAIALLAMVMLSACGGKGGGGSEDEAAGAKEVRVHRIGEAATLFDLKLTVDRIERTGEYNKQVLQPGTEFVLVHVTLENAGSGTRKYNSSSFELLSADGKPDLSVTTLNGEGELHIGDLAPGGKISGILPYEHPKNEAAMTLTFRPNTMSDQTIRVDLAS
ncbi:DUF4352 domain-containing protein [Cohnella soli]|uniref:DUF4352 domain-containing protein n=1 Tax=Cohnella soli TaxID=425005 RepID=A0ABW0HVP4_9BACL